MAHWYMDITLGCLPGKAGLSPAWVAIYEVFMKKTIEYEITDVDYFENDAILVVDGRNYYFQWDAKSEPTIIDALEFFKRDSRFYKE